LFNMMKCYIEIDLTCAEKLIYILNRSAASL
jgi:hypothetical protein